MKTRAPRSAYKFYVISVWSIEMKKSNGFGQRYAARQYARRAILAILVAASISGVARAQNSENGDAKSTAQRTEWSLIPELTFKNPFAFGANKEKEQEEKKKPEVKEEKDKPYLIERIFGRPLSAKKTDPDVDKAVQKETQVETRKREERNDARPDTSKERVVKIATTPESDEPTKQTKSNATPERKSVQTNSNATAQRVPIKSAELETQTNEERPKNAQKILQEEIAVEPQTERENEMITEPLPTLDDEEIQNMLRDFAALNQANQQNADPNQATGKPVATQRSDEAKQRAEEDSEEFLRELEEIKKLENNNQPVPQKFGYFKSDKPNEKEEQKKPFEPAPAVLFLENEPEQASEELNSSREKEENGNSNDAIIESDNNDDEGWISYESEDPALVADQRAFGTTRPVNPATARVPQGYVEPRRAAAAPNGVFSSNAYRVDNAQYAIRENRNPALQLEDVDAFAREAQMDAQQANEAEALDAVIVDSSDFSADELALETVELETLKEECFAALDHYTSLFVEFDTTYEWTEAVLVDVDFILDHIESNPENARKRIRALKEKIAIGQSLKERVQEPPLPRAQRENEQTPRIITRYSGSQRAELLDSLLRALERRAFVWSYAADYFDARNSGKLNAQQELTLQELALVVRATDDARAFFGDSPNGRNWRASFDVDELARDAKRVMELPATNFKPIATPNGDQNTLGYLGAPVPASPADPYLDQVELESAVVASGRAPSGREAMALERNRRMRFLHDRINAVAYKFEKTPMTPEQRRVFEKPTLSKWMRLVSTLAGDQTNGLALLYAFERYERLGGGDAGRSLQQLALRMTTSRSDVCRKFGRAFDAVYDNPNVKAYVSEALINRLLPVRDPEFAVVQERVLDNPVVGTRRVDTQVSIKLIPDPNRLLMNLNVNGRAVASTSSAVFSATLHNQSYVNYYATKTIEWRDSGIAYSPAAVSASATNQLNSVETDVDFVPLVGDVAREITRSQYEARQHEIREETRQKTTRETRERFDREANGRFDALNTQLRSNFFRNMANLGLSLRTQRSRTTEDWLLASLRFGSESSLGCQSTEPATLPGAFADVKLHESAVNAFITQLQLGGRRMTPQQTIEYLAVKMNKPQLRNVKIDDAADIAFTFAKTDPIVVRFFEDQAKLTLRFDAIELNDKTWNNIEIEVSYRPVAGENGVPTLTRDGSVEIYGAASPREQLPLRAVFSKVFPASKSFAINPEALRNDERFAGLALGLCRVSKGWFAISIIRDEYFGRDRAMPSRSL